MHSHRREKRLLPQSCPYVRPSSFVHAVLTGRFFLKFDIGFFHKNSVEKMRICFKSDKNDGHLNEELSTLYFSGETQFPKSSLFD